MDMRPARPFVMKQIPVFRIHKMFVNLGN